MDIKYRFGAAGLFEGWHEPVDNARLIEWTRNFAECVRGRVKREFPKARVTVAYEIDSYDRSHVEVAAADSDPLAVEDRVRECIDEAFAGQEWL